MPPYCSILPRLARPRLRDERGANDNCSVKKKPVKADVEVSHVSNWPSSEAFRHAPIEEDSGTLSLLFFRKFDSP